LYNDWNSEKTCELTKQGGVLQWISRNQAQNERAFLEQYHGDFTLEKSQRFSE
jgi:hypothetical protein